MIICPYCDSENIEGVDVCDKCGQTLNELHLPTPASDIERCLMRDRLRALPPSQPVTSVTPETTIGEVLRLLAEHAIGCVVVTQDRQVVGIFSERDALIRINTSAAEWWDRPVSDFMTPQPQVLDIDAKVAFAVHRMSIGHYRHVPVTDSQRQLTSIISVRDVLRYVSEKMA
jgi:CBS domain-containing protein